MPNKGGRYVIRNGSRELIHETKPAPKSPAKAEQAQPVKGASSKPAKAAKQEVDGNE
ncbi:hypothetical protein [Vreelandella sp.]|uniref:hypothetical protein n=1 Tax=Vreelandella sp. TaxID=3137778 RepID=UPI003BAB37CB